MAAVPLRLRSIFCACALLLCSPTACRRADDPSPAEKAGATPDARQAETLAELSAVLEKALAAYNAGDQAALFADFATTATPAPSDRLFTELFAGYYGSEFGKILAARLDPQQTVPDPDFGMLVCAAQCERVPLAKVSANFIREKGRPKIVQLRFEKVAAAD